MTSLTLLLMMQLVVSTKAGLVNHVQGATNVARMEMVKPGGPIQTGPDGYVEVLLNPGSFLRLDEDSAAVLDKVELTNVVLRIVRGTAIVEAGEIDKNYPIRVISGNLTTEIAQPGIFRFSDGVATVLEGKLQTAGAKFVYPKGWQVFYRDSFRAKKVGEVASSGLDVFSQRRSELIARANSVMVTPARTSGMYWDNDYWLFAPAYGWFTYVPRSNYRSPYGYRYYGAGEGVSYARSGSYSNTGGSSGGGGNVPVNTGGSNSGNSGGNSGGGGGSAPAISVSTPSGERSTPSVYIESKSSPVPATQ